MSLPPGASLGRAAPAVPLGGDPAPATQPVQDSGMGATGAAGVISRRRLSVDRSPGYRARGVKGARVIRAWLQSGTRCWQEARAPFWPKRACPASRWSQSALTGVGT